MPGDGRDGFGISEVTDRHGEAEVVPVVVEDEGELAGAEGLVFHSEGWLVARGRLPRVVVSCPRVIWLLGGQDLWPQR